jgi:hypothetical protein
MGTGMPLTFFLQCTYLGGDPDIGEGEPAPWRIPFWYVEQPLTRGRSLKQVGKLQQRNATLLRKFLCEDDFSILLIAVSQRKSTALLKRNWENSLMYEDIQMGLCAKSYICMRKSFLGTRSLQNFPIFLSVEVTGRDRPGTYLEDGRRGHPCIELRLTPIIILSPPPPKQHLFSQLGYTGFEVRTL